jgi:diaminopimelate decarboxylase/aspartate kinase
MTSTESPRRFVVMKFGGTSVSSLAAWETIAEEVRRRITEGLRPLVVCSALAGVSDALETLLGEATGGAAPDALDALVHRHQELGESMGLDTSSLLDPEVRALRSLLLGVTLTREAGPGLQARVLAFGELLSTRLGAAFLRARGVDAAWLDARDLLVSIEDPSEFPRRAYLSATCDVAPDPVLMEALAARGEPALVTQGFIARSPTGKTVLLGRGGSDTSAAYLAVRLRAVRCEIWTDVPGIFSANPRLIPQARLLRSLNYEEAQEIMSAGAKVLHPRSILPLRTARIPICLRDVFHPGAEGTVISPETAGDSAQVKAISTKRGVTLISMDTVGMWQQVGFLADAFACFKRHGISIDLVSTSETNVTVSLDPAANPTDEASLRPLVADLSTFCRARVIAPCAAVSLVGRNIRAILHLLSPALELFTEKRIYLVSQAASDLNLTLVVDEEEAERLAVEAHALLFGARSGDPALGPSWDELVRGPAPAPVPELPGAWWGERRDTLLAAAAEHGTPLFVYAEEVLDDAVRALQGLDGVRRIFYAMKANYHEAILRRFHAAGLGFECVSTGELRRLTALFPGMEPGRILFTPNFAPREEYREALDLGVMVTLDNLHPLQSWPELFAGREILVRLDPGKGRGHHRYVHTAGDLSKFGVPTDEVPEFAALAAAAGARVIGLHAHTGSGILTPDNWEETARFLVRMAAAFPDVRALDLGGGLGVPEKPGQTPLDLAALQGRLAGIAAAAPRFELWLEPGRYLVARAGVLLARVTQVKRKGAQTYVGVDVGMNTLIRPSLYGAYHHIVNLSRLEEPATTTASVVGPICESGDVLGADRTLPECREGDVLLIATAGAYGRAMSSTYNLRDPAAEIFI